MARETRKKQTIHVKRDSTSGCLTDNKADKARSVNTKATAANKKDSSVVKRDTDGRFLSRADKLFQRAWKDTYEKRDRRVG
jgi:hypothetical protein